PLPRWLSIFVKARTVLLTDLVDPPDIVALARACGTNRTTLQKIFQEHLGMGVAGFLREQRLHHAHRLLLQGEHRVEEIAHLVGYSGSHELRRAFKQRFGRLPSDVFRYPQDSHHAEVFPPSR
ncbi:MAG: AraC family transcriptional regulator, partial [Gammaproteobacteria bacterium]|nr:AraC family transcriptional regulator [Gammaproteobacteria bacterium]